MEKTFEWSEDGKVLLKLLDKEATEIVVPEGVEKIGDEAFKKCSSFCYNPSIPFQTTNLFGREGDAPAAATSEHCRL